VRALDVLIEVPKGSVVKREAGVGVEFLSPVPCPFNYGCVPGQLAEDGDPADALVLGPRLAAGSTVRTTAWLRVQFVDDGAVDDKLVCGATPPTARERARVERFFSLYAVARTMMNRLQGRGPARSLGLAPLRA
jgi:inorganic pyrophosphatase